MHIALLRFCLPTCAQWLPACLLLVASTTNLRADAVFNNLDQSSMGSTGTRRAGYAIQTGASPLMLTNVLMSAQAAENESFGVYARTANGTLGDEVFSDFDLSNFSNILTARANTSFVLLANSSYYLVLQTTDSTVPWNSTASQTYHSLDGVTIPKGPSLYLYTTDGYTIYGSMGDNRYGLGFLLKFQVNATVVPEPYTWALLLGGISLLSLTRLRRFHQA